MPSPLPTSRETPLGQVTAWYSWSVSGGKGVSFQAPAELELVGERAACPPLLLPPSLHLASPGHQGAHALHLWGWGQPLGFPACFLPSPPPLSHKRTGPGAGWQAGSHPGLADLHIKARGSPPPPHPPCILETFRWAEQYSWRSLFVCNCLFLIA